MKRDLILKMAASTMVITTTLTGCGPFGGGSVASSSSKPATVKDGTKYAKKAEKALAKGKIEKAVVYAERSVAGVGNDPETRALLGQAYLAAGRFHSAERSFLDAVELGQNDVRTILSLSLAQLAQGKANKAKQLIENNRNIIPTADYGLAMALAGETKTAIAELEQAIRLDNVTSRTRQNLGLAYALDGRWKEAKLMAMQDIAPAHVDNRIMQWAQMARPGAYDVRVASLLNVTPVANDPGQPVRLALNSTPEIPVMAASSPAQDYAQEVASFDRVAELPAVGPVPTTDSAEEEFRAAELDVAVSEVSLPASNVSTDAPLIKADAEPARKAPFKTVEAAGVPVKNKKIAPTPVASVASQAVAAVAPVMQKVAFTPRARSISSGKHLVQLGAFSSPESAQRAWKQITARNKDLAPFDYASSKISSRGKTLYRLAAMGFGNEEAAQAMCKGLKARGDNCIVRYTGGVRPTQMADAKPRKLASR